MIRQFISPSLIVLASIFMGASHAALSEQARLAIIIDDLGYTLKKGRQSIALNPNITVAIIPFTPYGKSLAKHAKKAGVEVMLHAPMEIEGAQNWENGLHKGMNRQEFTIALNQMLLDIPHVQGLNNHGGSALTQDAERMAWLMHSIGRWQLYFVDSRTSPQSIAAKEAMKNRIPSLSRDVFLDNIDEPEKIAQQFDKAVDIAKRYGSAIAIGHPYPSTLEVLEQKLSTLDEEHSVTLVPVSKLLEEALARRESLGDNSEQKSVN